MYLDKVYSGNVNIIGVGVWADTGNVAEIITSSNQTNRIFFSPLQRLEAYKQNAKLIALLSLLTIDKTFF